MTLPLKELMFFVILLLSTCYLLETFRHMHHKENLVYTTGLIYTLFIFAVYLLLNIKMIKDNYSISNAKLPCNPDDKQDPSVFTLSPGAICKGTPYLYSGDGEYSKMCQELLKTPEGVRELDRFTCQQPGASGIPRNFPTFSSNSDVNWEGIKCNDNK